MIVNLINNFNLTEHANFAQQAKQPTQATIKGVKYSKAYNVVKKESMLTKEKDVYYAQITLKEINLMCKNALSQSAKTMKQ